MSTNYLYRLSFLIGYLLLFFLGTTQEIKTPPPGFIFIKKGLLVSSYMDKIQRPAFDSSLLLCVTPRKLQVHSFYISQTEVTNRSYRLFTQWVIDSIALSIMAQRDPSFYLDESAKTLNWARRKEVTDSNIFASLAPLYVPSQLQSTNGKPIPSYVVNIHAVLYKPRTQPLTSLAPVSIYPDTLCWYREFPYTYSDGFFNRYFSHEAYQDYPVIGINYIQASAYCDWLSRESEYEYRLPTVSEFSYCYLNPQLASDFRNKKNAKNKQEEFITNSIYYPWTGFNLIDKNGRYFANFGQIKDQYNLLVKDYATDGAFYTAKTGSYPISSSQLYDLAGNVSEWVIDEHPTSFLLKELFPKDRFVKSEKKAVENNFNRVKSQSKDFNAIRIGDTLFNEEHYFASSDEIRIYRNDPFDTIVFKLLVYFDYIQSLDRWWSLGRPSEIKQPLNTIPLYDELESVLSIANDIYGNNLVLSKQENPQTVMGGSWRDSPALLGVNVRQVFAAKTTSSTIGFRVAIDANAKDN